MSSYKQGGILSCIYDVWISGTKLAVEKKACINKIEIKETEEGSDVATITISDPDFLYIEDNIFLEDNAVKIEMGWDGYTYRITFEGYISAIDINFDADGIPKLSVMCMDNTHRMNRKKKNNTYKKTTSAAVVKKIVKSYGYTYVGEKNYKFEKQETITQSNQTDIDFITKLASSEVYPFTAKLVGKKFYYKKMGELTTPKMDLTYREYPHEVISFNPQINKETKQVEVSSSKSNTKKKSSSRTKGKSGNSKKGSVSSKGKKKSSSKKKSTTKMKYNPKTRKWTKVKS